MSLKQSFVQAASLAYIAAASAIIELKEGDDVVERINEYDFAVVSFYNSEEWSVAVDQLIDGAKAEIEKQIADGKWSARNSLGWFRVDIEKHPEMALDDKNLVSDQMMIGPGLRRMISFDKLSEVKE